MDTPAEGFADVSREQVICTIPFTVRRAARWSECDPAGVVYAGNFNDYLLSAVQLFRRRLFGRDWTRMRDEWAVDLPAKSTSLIYQGSLWPDDVFDTTVWVGAVRMRTFDVVAQAVRAPASPQDRANRVFIGRHSSICVSASDRRQSVPLPPALRARLDSATAHSPAPAALLETVW